MNWHRVLAVMIKEWRDMLKNKMVISTMAAMPLLFVVMAVGTNWYMGTLPEGGDGIPPGLGALPGDAMGVSAIQAVVLLMSDQYMFYLLLVPMIIPTAVVAYSIVGEKEARSLEPLLATPLTTLELLTGKTLIAVLPAVFIGWASFLMVVVGNAFVVEPVVFWLMIRPVWALGIALLSPLLALLTTLLGLAISSRMRDIRAAQGVVGVAILPLVAVSMAVLFGQIALSLSNLLWSVLILVALCAITLWVAVRVFDREDILTRWG